MNEIEETILVEVRWKGRVRQQMSKIVLHLFFILFFIGCSSNRTDNKDYSDVKKKNIEEKAIKKFSKVDIPFASIIIELPDYLKIPDNIDEICPQKTICEYMFSCDNSLIIISVTIRPHEFYDGLLQDEINNHVESRKIENPAVKIDKKGEKEVSGNKMLFVTDNIESANSYLFEINAFSYIDGYLVSFLFTYSGERNEQYENDFYRSLNSISW